MRKDLLGLGFLAAMVAALPIPARGQETPAPAAAKSFTFDRGDGLAGWTTRGEVSVDLTKGRDGRGGALKVGPGGEVTLKLREQDASGRAEFWVYDDLTQPENTKTARIGPRWGLVQSDGKVFAVGILYASYLGGGEGYTATASDGQNWADQLYWLGVNRAPAAWHKWTINFDPETGLQILHDGRALNVDTGKAGLKGFSAIAIWGDNGSTRGQTLWVDDVSVHLGGPTHLITTTEADPYSEKALNNDTNPAPPSHIYLRADDPTLESSRAGSPRPRGFAPAPPPPKLEDLPLRDSVSEFGITWTFEKPVRVGQFVNGDWYVVGPATIRAIDPKPLYGSEIPRRELDSMDRERPENQRVRNGFMLNPPPKMKVAYDSGVRNWFDPSLIRKLPVAMNPGDSLVSTISMPKGLILAAQLRNKIERGVDDSSPIRTAAILTCLAEPQPADAFRPAFCDRTQKIYLARNLNRSLLPHDGDVKDPMMLKRFIRFTQRPWVGTCFFGFEEPVENMPQYGLEYGRVSGLSALLLCANLSSAEKEPLLVNYVQIGLDLGGLIRAGHPGWTGWGGHGSGRKLPIVFAGLLLGDEELANINRSFPKASFGEDEQTAYGESWTGAKVVFAGHSGIDAATGVGRNQGRGEAWGPYEHTPPSQWKDAQDTSESYRRCCTSVGWIPEALAIRRLHAEKAWDHDAFLDYADRWMYQDDGDAVKTIKEATGRDFDKDYARQGQTWDAFARQMWAQFRPVLQAPTNGWAEPHDESYYRAAIEKSAKLAAAKAKP